MTSNFDPYPVRVWVGYCLDKFKSAPKGRENFYHDLGSVFIPATVQIMAPLGLTAYLPTIVPSDDYPFVPDEIALVFYQSRDTYHDASHNSVGGRAYSLLHQTVFNFQDGAVPKSHSGFPKPYNGQIDNGLSYYYLLDQAVDWQQGQAAVSIAVNSGATQESFIKQVQFFLNDLKERPPKGMDGAVFTAFRDCFIFWTHWHSRELVQNLIDSLTSVRIVATCLAKACQIPMNFDDDYHGLTISEGDSFNFQFKPRTDV